MIAVSPSGTKLEPPATILLPNSLVWVGTDRDSAARSSEISQTIQHSLAQNRIRKHSSKRIRKPLLYPAELRDRSGITRL